QEPDTPLGRALATAVLFAADVTFRDLVRETIRRRDLLVPWIEAAGGLPQAIAQLSAALGVGVDETLQQVEAAFFTESHIASSEWAAVAAAFAQGSKNDKDQGARFAALSRLSDLDRLETYLDIFCTDKQSKLRERFATKAIYTAHPGLCERLTRE